MFFFKLNHPCKGLNAGFLGRFMAHSEPRCEPKKACSYRAKRLAGAAMMMIGIGTSTYYLVSTYRSHTNENLYLNDEIPAAVFLLKLLPLRTMSRLWGSIQSRTLPEWMREPVYRGYAWLTGANLSEVGESSLQSYPSLNAFFARELKKNARPISASEDLISPCDGLVLGCGSLSVSYSKGGSDGGERLDLSKLTIDQVKGFRFPIPQFLGETHPESVYNHQHMEAGMNHPSLSSMHASVDGFRVLRNGVASLPFFGGPSHPKKLYYCTFYLGPGDYHRFHSPTDWTLRSIRYITGELLPVAPLFVSWCRNVYAINERVPLIGTWKYGRFSMTPVGSTNVGQIKIHTAIQKQTNVNATVPTHTCFNLETTKGINIKMGEQVGHFNMGSTIVLVFEAPDNFHFTIKAGDKVQVGVPLGKV